MDEYHVVVRFEAIDTGNQREFLKAMNALKILEISRDDIEEAIHDMESFHVSAENRITLHGEEQKRLFDNFMKTFFPEKYYEYV